MRPAAALVGLLLAARAARAGGVVERSVIEDARDEVFARPEFARAAEAGESIVVAIVHAITTFFARFAEEYPVAYVVVVLLLLATVVILVAHIVWTLAVARGARYAPEPELPHLDLRRTAPEEFRARALRLAREGRYDEAVRDLYAALVLVLDRRGDLRYARHKALLDYRLEVRADDARAALAVMSDGYLPIAFGRRHLSERRFHALLGHLEQVGG